MSQAVWGEESRSRGGTIGVILRPTFITLGAEGRELVAASRDQYAFERPKQRSQGEDHAVPGTVP